jgi:hypothetical protein
MYLLEGLLLLAGFYPLVTALRANRRTTLWQPLLWALLAWGAWTAVAAIHLAGAERAARMASYLALCLTGCAGIAVLGARRPGVAAWNFVVVGLLAVLLLPVLNGMGEPRLETAHALFLGVALLVPLGNYLPTRLGLAALLLNAGCLAELAFVLGWDLPPAVFAGGIELLAVSPWVAWLLMRYRVAPRTEFDRMWLAYRDRFGFVWGQRIREQFNRASHHAGWPVVLRWGGLETTTGSPPEPAALLATLRAVLKRFGTEEAIPASDEAKATYR